MARRKRKSDEVYNARRRFRRKAERYLKKAQESIGATASRYKALAQDALDKAMATYNSKTKKPSPRMERLIQESGGRIDAKRSTRDVDAIVEASKNALEGSSINVRDVEAKAILAKGNIGSRFYAGLIDIWQGKDDIDQAIKDYFGKDSLMDVLEELESVTDIYNAPDSTETYHTAALELQAFTANYERSY